MNPKVKGSIFILFANVCFALNTSVSRMIIPENMPAYGLSLLRISFACLAFFVLGLIIKNNGHKFSLKDHGRLLICGLLGTAFNQLSFLGGLSMTSPVDASLICTCTPILTMIFASIIIKEPISLKKAGGVFIGMTGAIMIMYTSANPTNTSQTGTLGGDALVGVSCVVYGLYLVLVQPIMKTHSSIHVMKWVFFYGGMATFPFCYNQVKFIGIVNESGFPQYTVMAELAFALIIGTFLPYLLVSFALKLLRPTTVSMYNYIQPIITSTLAICIGQDVFTWSKPLSALLIFVGVYFVITSKSRADLEREKG
ncbi:MAG: DMT family transporter [Bacteroidales bacterium]